MKEHCQMLMTIIEIPWDQDNCSYCCVNQVNYIPVCANVAHIKFTQVKSPTAHLRMHNCLS